ncbi:MAG: helix-turn-helix domain-containing protein, partial [Phycisphaeraceae bacterium]
LTGQENTLAFLSETLSGYGVPPAEGILLTDDFKSKRETTLEVSAQLSHWLTKLEKPVGLLVQDSTIASLLIPICKELGLKVPEDVGIVGFNIDETISLATSPTLTYVTSNYYEHGYKAAALLDKLMAGKEVQPKHRLFAPDRVVVRASSDVFLCDDPLVSEAIRYIGGHVRQNPSVDEVAEHLCVSRRKLERHFAQELGRTIQTEIKRRRIEYIKRLLVETERSLSDIAIDFGFSSTSYFAKYFKDDLGLTPSAYRKKYGKISAE